MFTAGFAETGEEGREMQDRLAEIARNGGVRLCGPNCLGLFDLRTGYTPTFGSYLEEGPERPGPLGMVTQSGAFGTHLLVLAKRRRILTGLWILGGRGALPRPLFRAMGDRSRRGAPALRGGRDRDLRGPLARGRGGRRRDALRRALGDAAGAVPAPARRLAATKPRQAGSCSMCRLQKLRRRTSGW
jgi:hypothetical protein